VLRYVCVFDCVSVITAVIVKKNVGCELVVLIEKIIFSFVPRLIVRGGGVN
jgi:hypothetical protein